MYRLPASLRAALREPFGELKPDAQGVEAAEAAARAGRTVVAVGDVTTDRILEAGVVPRVMVVDYKTQRTTDAADVRRRVEGLAARGVPVVRVKNPPARITEELWNALATSLAAEGGPIVLEVEGEEDLATLPAVLLAQDGAIVCYGQPDRGMVVVTVDEAARKRVRLFLAQMES